MYPRSAYSTQVTFKRHLEERRQQADTYRLARELRKEHPGWVARQGRWILCQAASLLVAAGRRLERQGLPQTRPVEG
jgi:hypothetical protein